MRGEKGVRELISGLSKKLGLSSWNWIIPGMTRNYVIVRGMGVYLRVGG